MTITANVREVLAKWDPLDPKELANPYPTYAMARQEAPVFYNEYFDGWCVTRYDDVLEAVKNTRKLSSREAIGSDYIPETVRKIMPNGYPWSCPTLVNNDPPAHTRVRRLANEAFLPSVIAKREPQITNLVNRLIDEFQPEGHCDLVSQFASRLPQIAICQILGVPEEHAVQLASWSEDKIMMVNPNLSEEKLTSLARRQAEFYEFCDNFINEQRDQPELDTLTRRLIDARSDKDPEQSALNQRELISILSQLLLGGNSTTRRLLAIMILRLLEYPDQLDAVCNNLALAEAAVEETLRHSTSVKGLYRHATEDIELADVVIPGGSLVVILWASANRDESKFERPGEFDIFRPDADKHISFSRFAHFCLGAPLARLEACISLRQLITRLHNIRLDGNSAYEWEPLALHQGLSRLQLRWD